jgi:hypothetical protein
LLEHDVAAMMIMRSMNRFMMTKSIEKLYYANISYLYKKPI